MTNILSHISVYDMDSHLPYPSLGYILQETGENITENQAGSVEKANAFVRQMTKTAWLLLKEGKILDTQNKLEYLIATNEEYRLAFLDYVCSFIYDLYYGGIDNVLKPTKDLELKEILSAKTKAFINGSLLGAARIAWVDYEYRVGY